MKQKIIDREKISVLAKRLKEEGKKIVTTNGSFDILHAGHAEYLQEAKKQGDVLIVGLNSDSSIKAYKSKDRPIIPQEQRALMLAALQSVDYVVVFDETDPIKLLSEIKPDVHVNGAEYGEDCIEAGIVKKNGGRIHLIPRYNGLSTTQILEKISNSFSQKF